MTPIPRFARAALLLMGSAVVAGTVATLATPSQVTAAVPPLHALPWDSVPGGDRVTPPAALLYVSERCAHCTPAARAASAAALRVRATLLLVAHGNADSTARYRANLQVPTPLSADPAGALGRALGVRAVPVMFLFGRDGSRSVLVGRRSEDEYARALRSLR